MLFLISITLVWREIPLDFASDMPLYTVDRGDFLTAGIIIPLSRRSRFISAFVLQGTLLGGRTVLAPSADNRRVLSIGGTGNAVRSTGRETIVSKDIRRS